MAANSIVGIVLTSIENDGFAPAVFSTFGLSAILWGALAAGFFLLAKSRDEASPRSADAAFAAAACLFALIPVANVSRVVMTLFSAYVIVRSIRGSLASRAAAIFLTITVNLLWGRLLLDVFGHTILNIDAQLVSKLTGTTANGNMIPFIGQPGDILIAPGCSSLHGISIAIVFWMTINQLFGIRLTARSVMWCGLAIMAVMSINVLRLAAFVIFPVHFEDIHDGLWVPVISVSQLLAMAIIILWGARREVFSSPSNDIFSDSNSFPRRADSRLPLRKSAGHTAN